VKPQKACLVKPTLQEAEIAGNSLDVDVDQQLIGESAGGDSLHDVPLLDEPHLEVRLDGSVAKQ